MSTDPRVDTALLRQMEDSIVAHLNAEESKTPEEKRGDFMEFLRSTVADMNARALVDRLNLLAIKYGTSLEGVEASVSDVSFELVENDPPEIIAHCRLYRPVEQVLVTLTLSNPAD